MRVIKTNQPNLAGFNQKPSVIFETTSIGRTISFESKILPTRYVCACISE